MQSKQIYISDTNNQTILLSTYEKEVISTQLFNRLHHISQNSTAYLTFPTNRTKRFEHSLGTMKLCGDMFFYSIGNSSISDIENIFDKLKDTINKLIVEDCILSNLDKYRALLGDSNLKKTRLTSLTKFNLNNTFYNFCVPKNVSTDNETIYLIVFQAIRICGLLHDIGHPPFSHITESAINNIVLKLNNINPSDLKTNQKTFLDIISQYSIGTSGNQLHEQMGNKMTDKMISDILYGDSNWYKDKGFEEKYFKVSVFEFVKLIFSEKNDILKSLHRIIDGCFDGDRLDYVNRDIVNSGINNGKIEYDRVISSMKFSLVDNQYVTTCDAKTINTIEDFFFKRWYLYKNIIYHHRVIKTDRLLQNCIENIIEDFLKNEDNEKDDEKDDGIILPYNISGLWKAIKIAYSNTDYFNSLIQWDDNWLLTILKKHYFSNYYTENNLIHYQLEELLSNKKNYYSLIKHSIDFEYFILKFEESIRTSPIIETNEFNNICSRIPEGYKNRIFHGILAYIETYNDLNPRNEIKKYIDEFILEKYSECILDYFTVFKKIKSGLETEPIVHRNDKLYEFSKISNFKRILETEKNGFPYFYIYIKFKNSFIKPTDFEKIFLNNLGEYIANKINNIL